MTTATKDQVKIRDYGMRTHMSLDKEHLARYTGVFVCEGMPLHGKKFFKEESVRVIDFMAGCYGKSVATYYLDEEDSQLFDSIKSLISHYQTFKKLIEVEDERKIDS